MVGQVLPVLIERCSASGEAVGYSRNYVRVQVRGANLRNEEVPVLIEEVAGKGVAGRCLG
jgi:hypothetical protein